MTATPSRLLDLSVLVFAVTSMLSVGLGYTVRQIIDPLRNVRQVIRALIANFVLVPLLALLVLRLIPLDRPLAIGLFLTATAAGAPFLIQLVAAAESDVALSATLLVLLLPVTIIYMPIVVPLVLPEAAVSAGAIATPLVLSMLLPLAVGLFVRARAVHWARRLRPIATTVSSIALVALILATILLNLEAILDLVGTGAILASVLLVGGAFAIGFLLGSRRRESREVLGLGTGQRNIAAATVVATQAVGDPDTVVMVVVASLVALALLFAAAVVLRRHDQQEGRIGPHATHRRAA